MEYKKYWSWYCWLPNFSGSIGHNHSFKNRKKGNYCQSKANQGDRGVKVIFKKPTFIKSFNFGIPILSGLNDELAFIVDGHEVGRKYSENFTGDIWIKWQCICRFVDDNWSRNAYCGVYTILILLAPKNSSEKCI